MAPVPNRRPTPATDLEVELIDDLAARLVELGLTAEVNHDRREITARQPAVTSEAGAPPVGLSQSVYLARSRTVPDALAWVIRLDDGFRGSSGSEFEPIACGDDLGEAARRVGNILALTDRPAAPNARESVA